MGVLMKKSLYMGLGLMGLLCVGARASGTIDALPDDAAARTTPVTTGKTLTDLPNPLLVNILTEAEAAPLNYFLFSKWLSSHMKQNYLWSREEEAFTDLVKESFDEQGAPILDSRLVRELSGPKQVWFIKRLLCLYGRSNDQTLKDHISSLVTRQKVENIHHLKNLLLEFARSHPEISKEIIHLARGQVAHGFPMVHSQQMPYNFQEHIEKLDLASTVSTADGTFRVWKIPGTNDMFSMMATVSLPGGEEYVVNRPVYVNGNLQTEFVRILYRDSEIYDWPLKQ
jgi:hypothetical protein